LKDHLPGGEERKLVIQQHRCELWSWL